jgi:hypothetical protein
MSTATTKNGSSSDTMSQVLSNASMVGNRVAQGAEIAADRTEKIVKKYPLAAVGIAVGGGVLLGALVYRLFNPQKSVQQQLHLDTAAEVGGRLLQQMIKRIAR